MRLASLWRQLTRGLRAIGNPSAADRDVSDEVESYLEETIAQLEARGFSAADARRMARLELGGTVATREHVRTSGWEDTFATTLADVRHGLRRLKNNPGFTAVAVITLALGIGASTAIFSAVNPILFQSLPYPRADRIVSITDLGSDGSVVDVAFGNVREIAQRSHSFVSLAAFKRWQPSLIGNGDPERLEGQRVGAGFFHSLGVVPRLGRDFDSTDDRVNGPNVVILADGLWKRRFGADPALIGRPISLSGIPFLVIGVLPPGFDDVLAPNAGIWAPLQYDASLPRDGREWGHHLRAIGRLRDGVSVEQAKQELGIIARTPQPEFTRMPWAAFKQGIGLSGLQDSVTRGVRPALLAVLGAVLLLLAIACVNVINLLIARGAQRRAEFAMRVALGAGRGRLIRQVLTETVLLAGFGGALGMVVAALGVEGLVAISPAGLPRVEAIHVSMPVLLFGIVLTTAIGIVVGLVPALSAFADDPRAGLQRGTHRVAGGHDLTRRVLVVAEVALALVLLVNAGLLLRSLNRLFAISPGFQSPHVLTMQVQAAGTRFTDNAVTNRYFKDALDAVRRVPGVTTAAFTSQLALSGDLENYGVGIDMDKNEGHMTAATRYAVTPGYLDALRIPLVRGRDLMESDNETAPRVALVSESFVKHRFPGADPIGKHVQVGGGNPWMIVVGVVGDVKQRSLADDDADAVYMPTTQWPYTDRTLSLVVLTRGDAASLALPVRNALWSLDRNVPIVRIATLDHLVAATAADRRFTFVLFECFALVALLLAAVGIFGVLSGSVTERMREIGVRSALGATRASLLGLVLRQGMSMVLIGIVLGVGGAMASTRALVSLLFGVSRLDPVTYAGVIVVLAGVSAIACWAPAWRAAGVDPVRSLRAE